MMKLTEDRYKVICGVKRIALPLSFLQYSDR